MCGIVAYIGEKQAYDIVVKGLKRLEYRGYDSVGVATESNSRELSGPVAGSCVDFLFMLRAWIIFVHLWLARA